MTTNTNFAEIVKFNNLFDTRTNKEGNVTFYNFGASKLKLQDELADFENELLADIETVGSASHAGDLVKCATTDVNIANQLSKLKAGDFIYIAGRQRLNTYTNKEGVTVESIDFDINKLAKIPDEQTALNKLKLIVEKGLDSSKAIVFGAKKTIKNVIAPKASKSEIESAISGDEYPEIGF